MPDSDKRRSEAAQAKAKSARSAASRADLRYPLWYKDAIIYQLHVKAFFDSQRRRHRGLPRPDAEARLHQGSRRKHDLAVAVLSVASASDDGYDIADYHRVHPDYGTIGDFRTFVREAHRRGTARDHRARDQPHVRSASVVPGSAHARHRARRSATTTCGATRTRSGPRRGSSSPTPRLRTGRGTRSPRPTTGTASSRISRT